MEKFFGGPLVPTLVRLALLSLIVGLLLTVFGIHPADLWRDFLATVDRVWSLGFEFLHWSVRYLVLGAIIVVPVWLAIRVWTMLTEKNEKS